MKLQGEFTFISSVKRHSETYGDRIYVSLCDADGQCNTFSMKEFVEPFVLGDQVKATFNVYRKDNAYIVALETLDVM